MAWTGIKTQFPKARIRTCSIHAEVVSPVKGAKAESQTLRIRRDQAYRTVNRVYCEALASPNTIYVIPVSRAPIMILIKVFKLVLSLIISRKSKWRQTKFYLPLSYKQVPFHNYLANELVWNNMIHRRVCQLSFFQCTHIESVQS